MPKPTARAKKPTAFNSVERISSEPLPLRLVTILKAIMPITSSITAALTIV